MFKENGELGDSWRTEHLGLGQRQTEGVRNRRKHCAPPLQPVLRIQRHSAIPFGVGRGILCVRAPRLSQHKPVVGTLHSGVGNRLGQNQTS
jgi:hypothetical protein